MTQTEYEKLPREHKNRIIVIDPPTGTREYRWLMTPNPTEDAARARAVDVWTIWNDYQSNETKANRDWKGQTLTAKAPRIDEIEGGGKLTIHMYGPGFDRVQLDLKHDDEALELRPGHTVYARCRVDGMFLGYALLFKNCKLMAVAD